MTSTSVPNASMARARRADQESLPPKIGIRKARGPDQGRKV